MKFIKKLAQLNEQDLAAAGPKAVSLGKMTRKGIDVPAGFVILASAHDFCRETGETGRELKEKTSKLDFENAERLEAQAAGIRMIIEKGALPKALAGQIGQARVSLNAASMAIRPSAAGGDAMPAVRLEGRLGVGQDALEESVKACWASIYTTDTLTRLRNSGLRPDKVRLAVIVQKMAAGEAAGAVLSCYGGGSCGGRMLIEAVPFAAGCGAPGPVVPDRYFVNKHPVYIAGKTTGSRKDGGAGPKLTDREILDLGRTALKAEKIFSEPQDLEWVKTGGRIRILRARTAVKNSDPVRGRRFVWSNMNISEVMPGINPPLAASTMIEVIDGGFRAFLPADPEEPFLKDFSGRIYFNLTVVKESLEKITKTKDFPIDLLFGGSGRAAAQLKPTRSGIASLALAGIKIFANSLRNGRSAEKKIGGIKEKVAEFDKKIDAAAGLDELLGLEREIYEYLKMLFVTGVKSLAFPLSYYFFFAGLCRSWLGDKNREKANAFLARGSRELEMIRAFEALWSLSRQIKGDPLLCQKFLKADTYAKAQNLLSRSRDIFGNYRLFLDTYGHRCAKEIDFSLPRWSEDPTFIINTLKLYLEASEECNPSNRIGKIGSKQEMLMWETSRLLPFWKLFVFKSVLKKAESALSFREKAKSELIRILSVLRKVHLRIGAELAGSGFLKNSRDVFFVTRDEMSALQNGSLEFSRDFKDAVSKRKAEYRQFPKIVLGDLVGTGGERAELPGMTPAADRETAGLNGLAVSQGIAQGTARVVETIDDIWKVRPGDILVCDHTDPGWTPVFVIIKGLVSNTGGLLSHASIVAREYGLPAVVNIPGITKTLKDEQRIIVDGFKGTVKIVGENGK